MWCALVLLIVAVSIGAGQDASRLVNLEQGPVRGHRDPSTGVYIFSSIPYATAPTGSQRFQAPLPPPHWVEPIETDKKIICPQDNNLYDNKVMQEDCLIATVYVPDIDEDKLPVIVYVHGGAFQIGYGDMLPPKNFIKDKKLIAVTFNYRLGINGFLCLGTEGAPGNAGMKDQVAMLRWVKKNIASFGGNPDDVTIAGGSAGSVSVDLLMLSKAAEGLFNKVIPESGSSTGVIAMQIDPVTNAKNYAKSLGFNDVDDIYAMEKFLKSVPFEELLIGMQSIYEFPNSSYGFVPCIERDTGSEMILDDAPVNIIKRGDYRKVPMLVGTANMEGLVQIDRFPIFKSKMNEKFSDFLPADLQFESDDEREQVAKTVREFYFGDKEITEESILSYVDFFSDVYFAYPPLGSTKLFIETGHDQLYLYEFSFVDEDTPMVPYTNVKGAEHCAQTMTVLDSRTQMNPLDVNVSEEYKKMREILQELWYNFIKTGKPVPEGSPMPAWPPSRADRSPHMSLGVEVQLKGKLNEQRCQLWDDLYSRYHKAPEAPPALTA